MVNKYHLYLKYNLLYISILIFFSNCTTYLHHRRKDIQDTITVGIEKPGYGIGLRVSYLTLGFLLQGGESADGKKDLGEGIGFRGGDVGRYHSQQLIFGILGGSLFIRASHFFKKMEILLLRIMLSRHLPKERI